MPDQVGRHGRFTSPKSEKLAGPPTPATEPLTVVAAQRRLPTIDWASFNRRFDGLGDATPISGIAPPMPQALVEFENRSEELSGDVAGSANARRESTVHSPIGVFSFNQNPNFPVIDPATEPGADGDRSPGKPRADLLVGVPEDYAKLAVAIAAEEGVDPNWVLSIMRAENAGFDPLVVSSAGAVGLMQVLPKIGKAFGADDLTDPEQNIRSGTRFLRVLIDKYRNPVLVASAYNAGEPSVDIRHSLPLIRETADYVTRVFGFYTGSTGTPAGSPGSLPSQSESGSKRHSRHADRARSPMLVFSAADPLTTQGRPYQQRPSEAGGPVKIVKEEVHQ